MSNKSAGIDLTTVDQPRKRIQLLEKWKEHGYDGKR